MARPVVGDKDGERVNLRVVSMHWPHVTGHDLERSKSMKPEVILWPPKYKTGDMTYPYTEAKK